MTQEEYMPPRRLPSDAWIGELRGALEDRHDVVAAWFVTARYPGDEPGSVDFQDELHLELVDPPAIGAPLSLFKQVADVVPGRRRDLGEASFTWTFAPVRKLPVVRRTGVLLWSREAQS